MDFTQAIRPYASQPITHQLLIALLKDYKRPNDKVHALTKEGLLEPLKKGLYIAGPAIRESKPEPFLLANHILGPSYVSLDAALSFYGLIPERVFEITSMTTKAPRTFHTSVGTFSYTRLPLPYYSFGVKQVKLADNQYAMVASPEKALFDKVLSTSGLILRSKKNTMHYLFEDMRMEEASLKNFDLEAMSSWLPDAPKRKSLNMVVETLSDL